jgi:hypothetical protein
VWKNSSQKKLVQNFFRIGAGAGQFDKSDPDPDIKRPDPQHGFYVDKLLNLSLSIIFNFSSLNMNVS